MSFIKISFKIKFVFAVVLTMIFMKNSASAAEQAISLNTRTGQINGTLMLPKNFRNKSVVLIIAGSGPTDRNGNSAMIPGANNSLQLIAQGLADAGYASLRYDKRGIGASKSAGPSEADLRFDMYVDDAADWIKLLKGDPRFTSVTVLGHSEGSLIGMLAAKREGVQAFISVAGLARGAADVIRAQLATQLPPETKLQSDAVLAKLEHGEVAERYPEALAALFRKSVQPYLISWFKYIPAKEISLLKIPVLIVQGTTDTQVTREEAEQLKHAHPAAKLIFIDGMNHVLKPVSMLPEQQMASYSNPDLALAPQFLIEIVTFLNTIGN